jgi:hypothetical protein
VFRQAFEDQVNLINIININTELETFGLTWENNTTLYGGAGGVWSASNISNSLQNLDPTRTFYTTQARNSTGTVGDANSAGFSIGSDGFMTSLANSLNTQNTSLFENSGTDATEVFDILPAQGTSNIPGQNPAGGNGWNNNIASPGVQQVGSSGSLGSFGPVSNVEFMWDLYRIQARDNIVGQYNQGGGVRQGEYLGTLTLDNAGNVSFVTVPEPSTAVLLGLAGAAGFLRRRRK